MAGDPRRKVFCLVNGHQTNFKEPSIDVHHQQAHSLMSSDAKSAFGTVRSFLNRWPALWNPSLRMKPADFVYRSTAFNAVDGSGTGFSFNNLSGYWFNWAADEALAVY